MPVLLYTTLLNLYGFDAVAMVAVVGAMLLAAALMAREVTL